MTGADQDGEGLLNLTCAASLTRPSTPAAGSACPMSLLTLDINNTPPPPPDTSPLSADVAAPTCRHQCKMDKQQALAGWPLLLWYLVPVAQCISHNQP
jgi:hypothetical protein